MLRVAYYGGLRAFGLPRLMRRARDAGVLLCYHNVLPPRHADGVGAAAVHLAFERFAEQVDWLVARYAIIPLQEVVSRVLAGRSLRGTAAITFDDAYQGVFQHAWPLLRSLGLPATVFVVADRPDRQDAFWWDHPDIGCHNGAGGRERWLTELEGDAARIEATLGLAPSDTLPRSHRPGGWESIAAAASQGLAIGVHSATHRSLPRLGDSELEREIVGSRHRIAARLGRDPHWFAYPYGLWDARVRDKVHDAGYHAAVTLDYGLVQRGADPWALARVNVPSGIGLDVFEVWVAGLHPRGAHG